MAKHRKYTDADKENALAAFMANGGNYLKTAKEIGVPYGTLRLWVEASPFVSKVLATHKNKFIKKSWEVIFKALDKMKSKIADASASDLAKIIDTLYSKQALASTEPTSITQTNKVQTAVSAETKKVLSDSNEQGSGQEKAESKPRPMIKLTRAG